MHHQVIAHVCLPSLHSSACASHSTCNGSSPRTPRSSSCRPVSSVWSTTRNQPICLRCQSRKSRRPLASQCHGDTQSHHVVGLIQTSLNARCMLSLPIWNDVHALTGVIKAFLRRLPKPICEADSWKSLANTLPDETQHLTQCALLATLQGIRSQLLLEVLITTYCTSPCFHLALTLTSFILPL